MRTIVRIEHFPAVPLGQRRCCQTGRCVTISAQSCFGMVQRGARGAWRGCGVVGLAHATTRPTAETGQPDPQNGHRVRIGSHSGEFAVGAKGHHREAAGMRSGMVAKGHTTLAQAVAAWTRHWATRSVIASGCEIVTRIALPWATPASVSSVAAVPSIPTVEARLKLPAPTVPMPAVSAT